MDPSELSHLFSLQTVWFTSFVMAPEGHPFYAATEKGQIRAWEQKGYDWPLSKGKASGKVGAWMSGMLPDNR